MAMKGKQFFLVVKIKKNMSWHENNYNNNNKV